MTHPTQQDKFIKNSLMIMVGRGMVAAALIRHMRHPTINLSIVWLGNGSAFHSSSQQAQLTDKASALATQKQMQPKHDSLP